MRTITKGAIEFRAARERRGMTQLTAALELEIGPGYVAMLERGERRPGLDVALRIRDAFGVSVDDWRVPVVQTERAAS